LVVAGAEAQADSSTSVGSTAAGAGSAPGLSGYSTAASPIERSSEASAYNRAAINDPYNQTGFSAQQSFGLTATQMLGAAAACEQLHSDVVSGRRARPSKDPSDDDRASLEAAQQNMLAPAVASPNPSLSSEVDCDRVSGAFQQLQRIQIRDQDLAKALDQPDSVMSDKNRKNHTR
jgi:hypothetical protein